MKRPSKQYLALVDDLTAEIAELPETSARRARALLDDAQADIAASVDTWLEDVPTDDEMDMEHYRALLLALRRDELRKPHVRPLWVPALAAGLLLFLRREAKRAAELATTHIMRQATLLDREMARAKPIKAIGATPVMAQTERLLRKHHKTIAQGYAVGAYDTIKRQAMVSATRRETVAGMGARLAGERQSAVAETVGRQISDGLGNRLVSGIDRVVRTEVAASYNVAATVAMARLSVTNPTISWLKRWDASLDSRSCGDCRRMHGRVAALGAEFLGYGDPPLHPYCRCIVTVFASGYDVAEEE